MTFHLDLYNGFAVDDRNYVEVIEKVLETLDINSMRLPSKVFIIMNQVPQETINSVWARLEGKAGPVKKEEAKETLEAQLLKKYGLFHVSELPPMEKRKIAMEAGLKR